jgi:hypothetical protein
VKAGSGAPIDCTVSFGAVFQGTGATILRTARPATVTGVDPQQIHRKPVRNGLINENVRAASCSEDPQALCHCDAL